MHRKIILFLMLTMLALWSVGCATAATQTPAAPTPVLTQPSQIITAVVTATFPPPTETLVAPTVSRTVPLTSTTTVVTATKQAVAKATTAPRAATRTPTKGPGAATATALPMKFGAPNLTKPIWTDNQKDQVTFPGGAIVFDWQSVGGLNGDECYLVQVMTEPVNPAPGLGNSGDYWLTLCGDQTGIGASVKFTVESPNRVGSAPNYGSLIQYTNEMWAHWSVTVVKNLGQCDASYQFHCKWAPVGPTSKAYFLFKSG